MSSAAITIPCNQRPLKIHYAGRTHVNRYAFDRDYLERLTRGDQEIEAHFSAYFGELLLVKLRSRLRNQQLVADLRQETFLRVFTAIRKKGAVMYPERLGSFVNSVCENVLLEFFRSGKSTFQIPEDAPEPADQTATVESELITEERCGQVRRVLEELSAVDRTLLRGLFLEERDKDQICREMNIDRNHLRVRVHRALARFRSCLLGEGEQTLIRSRARGRGV